MNVCSLLRMDRRVWMSYPFFGVGYKESQRAEWVMHHVEPGIQMKT